MSALRFAEVDGAVEFCRRMQEEFGVDISAQAYKPNCPPVALTKLPLIATEPMIDALLEAMERCLDEMEGTHA